MLVLPEQMLVLPEQVDSVKRVYSVKRDLVCRQKRPITVSKETYCLVAVLPVSTDVSASPFLLKIGILKEHLRNT
jgi:hypothetical protein